MIVMANVRHVTVLRVRYTVHAATNCNGKPIRPPGWLIETLEGPTQ